MSEYNLYNDIYEATRTLDRIIHKVDSAISELEQIKSEGKNDYRLTFAISELKEAREKLGHNKF